MKINLYQNFNENMKVEILVYSGGKKFQIVLWIKVQDANEAENKVRSSFLDIGILWWYFGSQEFLILIDLAKKIFLYQFEKLIFIEKDVKLRLVYF